MLPAVSVKGEDVPSHCHSRYPDSLLHPRHRGHPSHLANTATPGPLPPLLHGSRGGQRLSGHHRPQSSLQEAEHSQDAALGPEDTSQEDARCLAHEGS